jgi:hypothetical protein
LNFASIIGYSFKARRNAKRKMRMWRSW